MQFLERDLEDIIYKTDNDLLEERGLFISGIKKRQVKIGNYGIADLITFARPEFEGDYAYITVYELKQQNIGSSTLFQASRYVKGIQRYLHLRGIKFPVICRVVLIGKSVDSNYFCYMPSVFKNLTLYTYDYNFDGISFSVVESLRLIDEGFTDKKITQKSLKNGKNQNCKTRTLV